MNTAYGSQMLQSFFAALDATRREFPTARTLPGAAYGSDDVYALERRAIFGAHWLCIGRTAELAATGDYLVREIAGESILVVRGDDDVIRAFHNVCRHRGSRLVDGEGGRALRRIVCPYHAWSYQLDGSLQVAPMMRADFCREDHGLIPVRIEKWHGFLFISLSDEVRSLADCFADLPDLTRYRMAELVVGKREIYDVQANWKLVCENYTECYHCQGAHPQLHKLTELIHRDERPIEIGACFSGGPMRLRDGVETMSNGGRRTLPLIKGLAHDDTRCVHYYVIYPNMLLSPHPDYVLVHRLLPRTAARTSVICEWLVMPDATAGELHDVADFWDVTNKQDWLLCERAQCGVTSAGYRQGSYAQAEDCVHAFDRWYAERMSAVR
jgi:glycine betaine catabolism A